MMVEEEVSTVMYLTAFLVTSVVGLTLGFVALIARVNLKSRGRRADAVPWAGVGAGALGVVLMVLGLVFPRLRGRTPPEEGAEFNPTPFTDPLVLSCGLGTFALVVGLHLVVRGDRSGRGRGW